MVEFSVWDIFRNLLLAARWTVVLSLIAFVGGGLVGLALLIARLTKSTLAHKLVDEVGDLRRAIAIARELGDLGPDGDPRLVHYPKPMNFLEVLREDRLSLFAAVFARGVRSLWRPTSGAWSLLSY